MKFTEAISKKLVFNALNKAFWYTNQIEFSFLQKQMDLKSYMKLELLGGNSNFNFS